MPGKIHPNSAASRLRDAIVPGVVYNLDDFRKIYGDDTDPRNALKSLLLHGMKKLGHDRYVWDPEGTYRDPDEERSWIEVGKSEDRTSVILRSDDGQVWIARPI